MPNAHHAARLGLSVAAVALAATCGANTTLPPSGPLALGTWGGDDAALIATDSLAHVHVGCTNGDIPGRVALDSSGRFSVSGSYRLRAYPIAVGPTLPAQYSGRVHGSTLTLAIAVNDTVEHKLVLLGPVSITLGREPRMGPCPICRAPGERARGNGTL